MSQGLYLESFQIGKNEGRRGEVHRMFLLFFTITQVYCVWYYPDGKKGGPGLREICTKTDL